MGVQYGVYSDIKEDGILSDDDDDDLFAADGKDDDNAMGGFTSQQMPCLCLLFWMFVFFISSSGHSIR